MALVNSAFTVNVTPGAMPPVVHVSEYDVGRTYTVTINGENGSAFNIPTGTTATVEGTLNGSVGFTQSATISNNQVSFALSESMTAYSGKAWCKIKLTLNDEPIQTCAFVLAVDRAGVEAETVIGASGFEQQIVDAVQDWLDEHPPAVGGMSEAFKQALLDCFENVAWINDDGQTYYDALYAALYPPKTVVSISAAFHQGSAVICSTDSLDALKPYLTVTAHYDDSSTGAVTNYTLAGTLTEGTSTITVLYSGKTTTFTVNVTAPAALASISAVFTQGDAVIYNTDSLDTLKQYLVVTATMTDSTIRTLDDSDYTLSGTLTEGTSTITVSYGGKTTTFNVMVTHVETDYTRPGTYVLNNANLFDLGMTGGFGQEQNGKTFEEIFQYTSDKRMCLTQPIPVSANGISLQWNSSVYDIFPAFFNSSILFVYNAFGTSYETASPKAYSSSGIVGKNVSYFGMVVKRKDDAVMAQSDITDLNLTLVVS